MSNLLFNGYNTTTGKSRNVSLREIRNYVEATSENKLTSTDVEFLRDIKTSVMSEELKFNPYGALQQTVILTPDNYFSKVVGGFRMWDILLPSKCTYYLAQISYDNTESSPGVGPLMYIRDILPGKLTGSTPTYNTFDMNMEFTLEIRNVSGAEITVSFDKRLEPQMYISGTPSPIAIGANSSLFLTLRYRNGDILSVVDVYYSDVNFFEYAKLLAYQGSGAVVEITNFPIFPPIIVNPL